MSMDYINEAFKTLSILDEEMFDATTDGFNALRSFMDNDDDSVVSVIDAEATSCDELRDSYIGKVIVNCNVCHSNIFKNKEEIIIDSDTSMINVEDQCPYCGESEGFCVVGEIAPFNNDTEEEPIESEQLAEVPTDATESASEESEPLDEAIPAIVGAMATAAATGAGSRLVDKILGDDLDTDDSKKVSRASRRVMSEDFKEVSIKTEDQKLEMTSDDNGKVTVTTEPIETEPVAEEGDTIVPVSAETEAEIFANNEEEPIEDDFTEEDVDFTDLDDESFDELGESYLKEVYENVHSFKTTSVSANDSHLVVEGLITFNSGLEKKTGFVFQPHTMTESGKITFKGHNKHFCEALDTYSLEGSVKDNVLVLESLSYNYHAGDANINGTVTRK